MVPGVSNRELFHAAVALYDVSLPEITPEILYSTVTEKWARTILLVRDAEETAQEYKVRFDKGKLGRKTIRTQTSKELDAAKSPLRTDSAALEKQDDGRSLGFDDKNFTPPTTSSRHHVQLHQPFTSARRSNSVLKDAFTETEPLGTDEPLCNGAKGSKPITSLEKWDTLWPDSDDEDNENSSRFGAVFSDSSSSSGSEQVQKMVTPLSCPSFEKAVLRSFSPFDTAPRRSFARF